jgi:hypothetical protein
LSWLISLAHVGPGAAAKYGGPVVAIEALREFVRLTARNHVGDQPGKGNRRKTHTDER